MILLVRWTDAAGSGPNYQCEALLYPVEIYKEVVDRSGTCLPYRFEYAAPCGTVTEARALHSIDDRSSEAVNDRRTPILLEEFMRRNGKRRHEGHAFQPD